MENKDLKYWRQNAEEDYMGTPISVLRYISELEKRTMLPSDEEIDKEAELVYIINKGGLMWMPSKDDINKVNKQEGFSTGAKWVVNLIKQQDNEK
jgi:hypothetical protein